MSSNKVLYEVSVYSEKACAVFFSSPRDAVINGYDELMTQLGGKKNPSLKGLQATDPKREGYIFSIKRKAEIEKALAAFRPTSSSAALTSATVHSSSVHLTESSSESVEAIKNASSSTPSSTDKMVQMLSARVEALETQLDALQRLVSTHIGVSAPAAPAANKRGGTKVATQRTNGGDDDNDEDMRGEEPTPSLIVRRR